MCFRWTAETTHRTRVKRAAAAKIECAAGKGKVSESAALSASAVCVYQCAVPSGTSVALDARARS